MIEIDPFLNGVISALKRVGENIKPNNLRLSEDQNGKITVEISTNTSFKTISHLIIETCPVLGLSPFFKSII